jgi:hypothetical protein
VVLRILRSNVDNRRGQPTYEWLVRILNDFEINLREQAE